MERFWTRFYPPGVGAEIDADAYPSLPAMMDEAIGQFGEAPAVTCFGQRLSYRRLGRLADAFAAHLREDLRLMPGDRMAIMSPNLLQYPVALLGMLRAGLTVVNVNPLYTARELHHQLVDSGAVAILLCAGFTEAFAEAVEGSAVRAAIVTRPGDMLPASRRPVVDAAAGLAAFVAPAGSGTFRDAIARGLRRPYDRPAVGGSDLAFLQYTGGTTGISKGAMLTHRNVVANVLQGLPMLSAGVSPPVGPGDVVVTPLPLYHIFALGFLFALLRTGAENVLIPNPRDMDRFIATIAPLKMRMIMGINTLLAGLMAHPRFGEVDVSQLDLTLTGGGATQSAVAERWQALTGATVREGYGLSETSPVISVSPAACAVPFDGSCGLPVPSLDLKLVDEAGREVGRDQAGELAVRGPNVMPGYWNSPAETARVFDADGWFLTGDIARIGEDGRLRIVDRKKDMILVSGFNVYPNEVENVLAGHPGVAEVVVVGAADARTGEAVVAVVVPRDPAPGVQDLQAYAATRLARYKVPQEVRFVDALPKTNVGKILRRVVRDQIAAERA